MAVSPFDKRKKTQRAQLDDVRQQAVTRAKAATNVARKLDSAPINSRDAAWIKQQKAGQDGPPTTTERDRSWMQRNTAKGAPTDRDGTVSEKTAQYSEAAKRLAAQLAKPGPGATGDSTRRFLSPRDNAGGGEQRAEKTNVFRLQRPMKEMRLRRKRAA